jgi:hypothetical protein
MVLCHVLLIRSSNVAVVLLVCLLFPITASAEVKPVRRVLILNEVNPIASPGVALIHDAIRTRLDRLPYQIELYVESLETILFSDPATQREFFESYIHKYQDRKPDVVIAVGPSSLRFLAQSQESFFAHTPVAFLVSTPVLAGNIQLSSSFTGVWGIPDFAKTLDVALKLFPDTRHVVVVGGVGGLR